MRRIGLIGGLAWPSTEAYHRRINQEVNRRLGDNHSARLVVWAEDFELIATLQREGRWDEAGDTLAGGARALEAAGADLIAICANTMHLVAPAVRDAVDIPLVNLIEVVSQAAQADGLHRLGLLGTAYTMSSSLYPDVCGPLGIDVLVPDTAVQGGVQSIIYEDLTRGLVTERAATITRDAAEQLLKEGADAIVLGCTELGLVLHAGDVAVPVLDTTEMHVSALVDAALA